VTPVDVLDEATTGNVEGDGAVAEDLVARSAG
jgi:hypothetical protein